MTNPALQVSKLDAARRQLEGAITLYFNWGDSVSIHTLAAASRNVLADLCEHRNIKPWLLLERMVEEHVKPEHQKMLHAKIREAENFFKHADRDPETTLKFNPGSTEFMLLEGTEVYFSLTTELPPLHRAYRGWWMLQNRHMFTEAPAEFRRTLEGIQYAEHERTKYFNEILPALFKLQSS